MLLLLLRETSLQGILHREVMLHREAMLLRVVMQRNPHHPEAIQRVQVNREKEAGMFQKVRAGNNF